MGTLPGTDIGSATLIEVRDNQSDSRFEISLDGTVVGHARYVDRDGRVVITHTEIDPSADGKGLGSKLAAGTLDLIRERGQSVVPLCPFFAGYIERHVEYADLVDTELLAALGRG